jgi:hypothetical protein
MVGYSPESRTFRVQISREILFWGDEGAIVAGGAQRTVIEPKKTGARSARARQRVQKPLVINNNIVIIYFAQIT